MTYSADRLKKYEPLFECLIDKYEGSGASGAVYKLINMHDSSKVSAVKIISIPSTSSELDKYKAECNNNDEQLSNFITSLLERYKREVDVLYRLKGCPNVVRFLNYSVRQHEDGIGKDMLIQMEYLTSLTKVLSGDISVSDVIKVGTDLCNALDYLQKHNTLHRDIKPDNIFYDEESKQYKLGDFGIAKLMEGRAISSERGTPLYNAPEVEFKSVLHEGDIRSDLYSLGLVMYRMLNNNRLPFVEDIGIDAVEEARIKRLKGETLPAPALAAENENLANIVLKACAYNAKDRFGSASEMKAALEKIESPKPGNSKKRTAKKFRSKKLNTASMILPVAAMVYGLILAFILLRAGNEPEVPTSASGVAPPPADYQESASLESTDYHGSVPFEYEPEPVLLLETENTVTFTLSPRHTISDEDYAEALRLITERVQSMTDTYIINDNGMLVTITMLESNLGTTLHVIEKTVNLIAGRGTLSVWGGANENTFGLETNEISNAEPIRGILDFEIPQRISAGNWEYDFVSNPDRDNMLYICVSVTGAGVDNIREAAFANNSVVFMNADISPGFAYADFDALNIGIFRPIRGVDYEFYIILYDFNNESLNNLVATIINQPLLPVAFSSQIEPETIWETADESVRGRYQQDEITGSSVTLLYEIPDSAYREMTEEEFLGIVSVLRSRMDAIGNPYAIGFSGLNGRNIAIKTSPARLGADFINLIGNSGTDIRIETRTGRGFDSRQISAMFINSGGTEYSIDIVLDSDVEIPDEIINETVYLFISGVRISSTVVAAPNVGRTVISFSVLSFVSHSEMSGRNRFILDFLNEIVNGEDLSSSRSRGVVLPLDLNLLGVVWEGHRDVAPFYRWGINSFSHEAMRVRGIIAEQFNEAVFRRDLGGGILHVYLDLDVNDELPQRFVDLVIDIFTACDFENTSYNAIFFYNENNAVGADRFRIIFRRVSYPVASIIYEPEDEGEMSFTYRVRGPTFSGFLDEMESLFDSTEFFSSRLRRYGEDAWSMILDATEILNEMTSFADSLEYRLRR